MNKKNGEITIRSSAAEYLTYVASIGDQQDSIEMRYEDESIWLTQKMMAALYDVSVPDEIIASQRTNRLLRIYHPMSLNPCAEQRFRLFSFAWSELPDKRIRQPQQTNLNRCEVL